MIPASSRRRLFDEETRHLDRFGPLLVLTILTIVVMSLVPLDGQQDTTAERFGAFGISVVIGVTFLLALRAAGVSRRWRRAADAFVAFAVFVSLLLLTLDVATDVDLSAVGSDRPSPVWVIVAMLTPLAVIRRLLRHKSVSIGTLYGAIAAYLLIAVGFAYLFGFLDDLAGAGPFFEENSDPSTPAFMYFSLVTLTTLGYGDLSPADDLGRFLAVTEAVIGQVYLVTFVAMLVGLLIQQRGQD